LIMHEDPPSLEMTSTLIFPFFYKFGKFDKTQSWL
jgi:hypothetical protein